MFIMEKLMVKLMIVPELIIIILGIITTVQDVIPVGHNNSMHDSNSDLLCSNNNVNMIRSDKHNDKIRSDNNTDKITDSHRAHDNPRDHIKSPSGHNNSPKGYNDDNCLGVSHTSFEIIIVGIGVIIILQPVS